jgi:hypothetical protein
MGRFMVSRKLGRLQEQASLLRREDAHAVVVEVPAGLRKVAKHLLVCVLMSWKVPHLE